MMIARIFIPDFKPLSKQHSRGMCYGRVFTNANYTRAKNNLRMLAKMALIKKGWREPTKEKCALYVGYKSNRMDVDNVLGFVMDALQDVAYIRDSQIYRATAEKLFKGPIGLDIRIGTMEATKFFEEN
jgi:Holliday junction resolvase RusA-like endonuclease